MFKKIYYFILRKYCDWTNDYNDFPGHRLAKDIKWILQKIFRGYSDLDLWNLDNHLAKILSSRLKAYKRMKRFCYPPPEDPRNVEIKDERDWEVVLDEMIEGFDVYLKEDIGVEETKKVERAFELFAKYFGYLWD